MTERIPLSVKLSVAERAKLEAVRARMGLRSMGEVVRQWIAREVLK